MVDLYRLPRDFPGVSTLAPNLTARDRVARLERELAGDLLQRLGGLRASQRFIPYIQLHEFEALLFSDPTGFLEAFPERGDIVDRLTCIRSQFKGPEEINDGAKTAPSERILAIASGYQKPVAGLLVAKRIGLAAMRRECTHFAEWFARLLALADPNSTGAAP
jgi:Domain of unknown function (DUF4276)